MIHCGEHSFCTTPHLLPDTFSYTHTPTRYKRGSSVDWFNATTGAFVSAASFESSGAPFHLPVPTFQYGVVGKVLPAAGGAAPPDAAPQRLPLAGGLPGGRHRGRKT